MSPSSAQIIGVVLASDANLSPVERSTLQALLSTDIASSVPPSTNDAILLTQKEAATLLGVDRTTVWRLTSMGILRPTEISPGTFRYRRAAVEALAQHGYRHFKKMPSNLAA